MCSMFITGGRILTMEGQVYENGTIQIENGKIKSVREGAIGNMPTGKGKKILDVQGAWIMPGIIEPHCHIGISEEKKEWKGMIAMKMSNPPRPIFVPLMPLTAWMQP